MVREEKMEKMPLISIVVPVYNPKVEYFRVCVASLWNQTYSNIEILLIDDGSDREAAQLCDEFAVADERIRVLHKNNKGPSSARNAGMDIAEGEYLVFVDSDDYVNETMVARGYEELIKHRAQIVAWTFESFTDQHQNASYYKGNDQVFLERENLWRYRAMMLDALIFDDLQFGLCMTPWGKMYDMSLLRSHPQIRFNEGLKYGGEDNDFLQKLLSVTDRFFLFHENLYYYRDTEGSMTSKYNPNYMEKEYEILKVLELDIGNEERLEHAFDKYCCNYVLMACINYLLHKNNKMDYWKKRKQLKEIIELPEIKRALYKVDKKDFPTLKYFFMLGARYRWYDLMMLLAWGCKKYRKL